MGKHIFVLLNYFDHRKIDFDREIFCLLAQI